MAPDRLTQIGLEGDVNLLDGLRVAAAKLRQHLVQGLIHASPSRVRDVNEGASLASWRLEALPFVPMPGLPRIAVFAGAPARKPRLPSGRQQSTKTARVPRPRLFHR